MSSSEGRGRFAPLQYSCDVCMAVRLLAGDLPTGAALTEAELARVDAAYFSGMSAARFAVVIVQQRERPMYVSEPITGVESPFYAKGRYFANAEDARRERTQ